MAETKDKPTVTIQLVEEEKKKGRKPKERKRRPSDSPNWRNKDVPLPTEEETSKEKQETQGEQTSTTATIEETTEEMAQESEVTTDQEEEETQAHINILAQLKMDNSPLEELWINMKTNVSQKLAIHETVDKKEKTVEEMVPPELLDYKDVFDKVTAERFPESRPWDHAIDLKEDFVPLDCKVYPMTLPEQAELDKFIDENLAKGYIRPSKSPMASPFFFVSKKDGKL